MPYQHIKDNIYAVGAFVYAKADPAVQLQISAYNQRIYYCTIVANPSAKQKAYFERELVTPEGHLHASAF